MHRSPPHSILQLPHNDLSKMVQRLCRIPCILTDSDGMCVCAQFRWYVRPWTTVHASAFALCFVDSDGMCAHSATTTFMLCFSDGMCDVHRARQCFARPAAALGFVDIFNNTSSKCFSCFLGIVDNVDASAYTRTLTNAFSFVYGQFYARIRALVLCGRCVTI